MTEPVKKLTDDELSRLVAAMDKYARFNQVVKVKKLTPDATLPIQGRDGDFAFDLYLSEDILIPPSLLSASMAHTGISTSFDEERWGLFVSPRSSIFRLPLILTNSTGIIEGQYRGELGIPLRNTLSTGSYDVTSFAITIEEKDNEKKYVRIPVTSLDNRLVRDVLYKWRKEYSLIHVGTIKNSDLLPMGTIFLPKGFRITQCYLIPKVNTVFQETDKLPDSFRGAQGFGSSGMSN